MRGVAASEEAIRVAGTARAEPVGRLLDWKTRSGRVSSQRRVLGKRGVKTDQVDLVAMFDLLVAGRGQPVEPRDAALLELQAWTALRCQLARPSTVEVAYVSMSPPRTSQRR